MTEVTAQTRREGDNPFAPSTERDNSAESQSEKTGTETQAPGGDDKNNRADNTKPFNENPRWQEREDDWKKRFDTQESRHQEDLRKIREEFGQARNKNEAQSTIPQWFGGDQAQWDAYRADRDADLKSAEERAYERVTKERSETEERTKKLQDEANSYLQAELAVIETDKTLNPTGAKVDVNKFLKYVIDNKFVDIDTNKWDYRKAWKYFQLENPAKSVDNTGRKNLAGATGSNDKGESKTTPYKTNKDFKTKRPW